jgi:phage FluMu gp28-like protein
LSYQQAWLADQSPVKVIEKSRRIGISWADAADSVLAAASQDGQDIWYIGYNKEMAEEYILNCVEWADRIGAAAENEGESVIKDPDGDILIYRLRLASGCRIVALSSKPANLRGKQGKVKIDEAAFHNDLPGLLKAALALRMWGGSISIMSTHDGYGNKFNELIIDCRSGSKPYSVHRVSFTEAVNAGLYRKICEQLGLEWTPEAEAKWVSEVRSEYGADTAEELDVIPAQGGGTPFPRALVEQCMSLELPVLRLEKPKDFAMQSVVARETDVDDWCADQLIPVLAQMDKQRRSYAGMDFGRSGDLSVIFLLQELPTPPPKMRCPVIVEMDNIPHEQQKQVLWYLLDRLPRLSHIALDARGNGSYLAEVTAQRYGSRVTQVMLSEGWYRDNMAAYQAAYQDRQVELPYSLNVIDDHRALKMIDGVIRLPKATGQAGRHGDSAIAGALAWFSCRQNGGGPIEYHRIEPLRSSGGGWQRRGVYG